MAQSDTARVHVLLVGLGSIGQALLVQLAKTGHYRSGLHPKVTIVDRQVSRQWSNLIESFPTLQRWIEVELIESHIEDLKPTRVKEWLYDKHPVSMAYVTTSDEVANLKVARMLISNLQNFREEKSAPVTEVVVVDPPGGYVLSDYETNGSHNGNIHLFSLSRGGQRESKESFLSYLDDSRAKAMHAAYLRHNEMCPPDDPTWQTGASNASWDKLPEFLRESNRQLADFLDFEVKLRSIGCQLVTKGQDGPVRLRQYELDQLSRLEHQRWWSERELDGWQYSERPNRDLKLSSKMVDFDQLSPKDKRLDEKAVTDLISQLADEGLIVVRA